MKYVFKMMAVVFLSFSMSGCVEMMVAEAVVTGINAIADSSKSYKYSSSNKINSIKLCNKAAECSNSKIYTKAKLMENLETRDQYLPFVKEAKRRGVWRTLREV